MSGRLTTLHAVGLAALLGATPALARDFILEDGPAEAPGPGLDASRCTLTRAGSERATSADCGACHAASAHSTHPVDLDYERSRLSGGAWSRDLRPAAEVQRRGVRLVDGQVTCVTCHDGKSRVAGKIALPHGSLVRGAVSGRDPGTYLRPAPARPIEQVPDGAAVSPTALCKACHALD